MELLQQEESFSKFSGGQFVKFLRLFLSMAVFLLAIITTAGCGDSEGLEDFIIREHQTPADKLRFESAPGSAVVGQPFTLAVRVIGGNSRPKLDAIDEITLSLLGRDTKLNGKTTLKAQSGIATFEGLSIDRVGSFVIDATAPGAIEYARTRITILPPKSDEPEPPLNFRLFTSNAKASSITVHDETTMGDKPPLTTVSGAELNSPAGLAISGSELFCANSVGQSVTVYSLDDSGAATLVRTISGDDTGFGRPIAVALSQTELFVADARPTEGSVRVFPRNGSGEIIPTRTLTGPISGVVEIRGVALSGTDLVCLNENSVRVFNQSDITDDLPQRVIQGSLTGLGDPRSVAVAGEEVFVVCGDNAVRVFDLQSSGNVAPKRVIVGSNTGLSSPSALALDPSGHLFVSSALGNSISVFRPGAVGNVVPRVTIAGAATGLSGPAGLAVMGNPATP